jgi:hypothetical protein
VKDRAIELADKGDLKGASQQLRNTISELSANIRKELRDQSYQASTRNRNDLALRGTAGGSADELEAVSSAEGGWCCLGRSERRGRPLAVGPGVLCANWYGRQTSLREVPPGDAPPARAPAAHCMLRPLALLLR